MMGSSHPKSSLDIQLLGHIHHYRSFVTAEQITYDDSISGAILPSPNAGGAGVGFSGFFITVESECCKS